VQQFSDKDPQFFWLPIRTSCLDIRSETANDELDMHQANHFITPALVYKWNIYWNANTETASYIVISLTLMAYMHKMLQTYNNDMFHKLKIMFYMFTDNSLHIW